MTRGNCHLRVAVAYPQSIHKIYTGFAHMKTMRSRLSYEDEILNLQRVNANQATMLEEERTKNHNGAAQVERLSKELADTWRSLTAEEKRFQCMSDRLLRQEKIIEKQEGTIMRLQTALHRMVDEIARGDTAPLYSAVPLPDKDRELVRRKFQGLPTDDLIQQY